MTSPRLRKVLRWSLGVSLSLVVMLVAALMIAERWIDTPKVRADLSAKLSQLVHGEVVWRELHVRLLPRPHAVVSNAHFAIPNVVTVDAAEVEVTLRLLPLFRGSAQLKTVTVKAPSVDIWIAKSAEQEEEPQAAKSPLDLYRAALRPVADIVARFAPATTLAIDDGRVALHLFDLPPFETTELDLRIVTDDAGAAIDASATGTYWERIVLDGRIEFADLRSRAKLEVTGLKPQPILEDVLTDIRESLVLSSVSAKLEARTDGRTDIAIALDLDLPKAELQRRGKRLDIVEVRLSGSVNFTQQQVALQLNQIRLGELVPAGQASLVLTGATRAPKLDIALETLDLKRLGDAAVLLAGDQPIVQNYIAPIRSGRLLDLRLSTQADTFKELFELPRLRGSVQVDNGGMRIPVVAVEARQVAARVELVDGALNIQDASARLGTSRLRQASTRIVLVAPMRLEDTRAQASLVLHDLLPSLRRREPLAKALRSVPELSGVAEANIRNLALRFDKPSEIAYDITVKPQRVRVQTDALPGPLGVHGGSVRVTSRAINAARVGIEMLDLKASVSAEMADFQSGHPRVTARVADGVADRKVIDWIWRRANLPARLLPDTPLRFAASRVQWSDAGLDLAADAQFDAGPAISADLFTRGKTFTLRRATIKDRDSDATISFSVNDSLVEMGFAGTLASRTLAAMLAGTQQEYAGRIAGDIQLTLDLDRQRRTAVRGKLTGERMNLANLLPIPLKVERFDFEGDGDTLHMRELTGDWAEQKLTLRGDVARQGGDLIVKAELDTPGIVIDALRGTPAESAASPAANKPPAATKDKSTTKFDLWSLPIKGTVALRADYLEYQHRRVEGVRAIVTLEKEAATLSIAEASLCGIGMPLSIRVVPQEFDASVRLSGTNVSLGSLAQCLRSEHFSVTGNFDVNAALSAKGSLDNIGQSITRNLSGAIDFKARDGQIRKLALLGNILSLKSVSELVKGDVELGGKGFPYREIAVRGKVGSGKISIEQAALDSGALGLAATGSINLENYDSRLTVLVAPFGTLDRIARKIPIVGYIMGGALTSIPVGVSGDIRSPLVVPLGPGAVGSEVLGIFERTFKLPGKLIESTDSWSK